MSPSGSYFRRGRATCFEDSLSFFVHNPNLAEPKPTLVNVCFLPE